MGQPDELVPIGDTVRCEHIGDLPDRIALRNRDGMKDDAACHQLGEDLGRRQGGMQLIFTGADLSFSLQPFSQPHKCRTALDQLFPLKNLRDV